MWKRVSKLPIKFINYNAKYRFYSTKISKNYDNWDNDAIEHYNKLSIKQSQYLDNNHSNDTITKANINIKKSNYIESWDDETIDHYNNLAISHSQYN